MRINCSSDLIYGSSLRLRHNYPPHPTGVYMVKSTSTLRKSSQNSLPSSLVLTLKWPLAKPTCSYMLLMLISYLAFPPSQTVDQSCCGSNICVPPKLNSTARVLRVRMLEAIRLPLLELVPLQRASGSEFTAPSLLSPLPWS